LEFSAKRWLKRGKKLDSHPPKPPELHQQVRKSVKSFIISTPFFAFARKNSENLLIVGLLAKHYPPKNTWTPTSMI
jgi:hypothetical protein